MQDVFDAAVDRTRSRLDVPQVITLFGAKMRPRGACGRLPPRLEVAIGTPAYDLTKFKVHFGNLTLKGYKADASCGSKASPTTPRTWPRPYPGQVHAYHHPAQADGGGVLHGTGLRSMPGFIPDGLLDALPAACQLGGTRAAGIDVSKPRSRAVLAAALALAIAPGGFTVACG